ncbi:hypothetical protein EES37_24950 [Streptomyces sp. ADI91-18]|nr:hypothetical protein EES37_24950 [Streptomyces sp. ADI91-18]
MQITIHPHRIGIMELIVRSSLTRDLKVASAGPPIRHRASGLTSQNSNVGNRTRLVWSLSHMIPELLRLLQSHTFHQFSEVMPELSMHQYSVYRRLRRPPPGPSRRLVRPIGPWRCHEFLLQFTLGPQRPNQVRNSPLLQQNIPPQRVFQLTGGHAPRIETGIENCSVTITISRNDRLVKLVRELSQVIAVKHSKPGQISQLLHRRLEVWSSKHPIQPEVRRRPLPQLFEELQMPFGKHHQTRAVLVAKPRHPTARRVQELSATLGSKVSRLKDHITAAHVASSPRQPGSYPRSWLSSCMMLCMML